MLVFCSLLIVLFVIYVSVQWKFYCLAWKIGGPIGLPFIGCIEFLSPRTVLANVGKLRKTYSSPATAWLGPACILYISDPVNVKRILTSPDCINKIFVYDYMSEILGSGLVTSKNPEWSSHRKLLNPAFKIQSLVQFVPIFNTKAKVLCDQLKEFSLLKQPFNLDDILQKFTFNISCETILGQTSSIQLGKGREIVESYNLLIEITPKIICNPLYKSSMITKVIDSGHQKKFEDAKRNIKTFLKTCVEETSKQFQKVGSTNCSLISHAVEVSRKGLFSTDDVISEMNHMLVASYDTTSKALLHTITLLAMYPEWQEKLYGELEEMFPDKDVELSFEDIQETPLMDMIIKESLRLLPVVPLQGRITSAEYQLFDGVVLPKGTNIAVDIYSMHRDPKYWGADALHFNPYRFMQDEIAERDPFVYIPFSKGMRNCIGWRYANLAMKVFLAKVFHRFRFATTMKPDELDITFNILAKFAKQPLFTIEDRLTCIHQS